jgi:hypothetical protein
MPRRPVSVIEFAAYRRRADELLTASEQDAVLTLSPISRLAAI